MFLARLWGIETSEYKKEYNKKIRFLARLWGIETNSGDKMRETFLDVFSSPMRDWNFDMWCNRVQNLFLFLARLWGIET